MVLDQGLQKNRPKKSGLIWELRFVFYAHIKKDTYKSKRLEVGGRNTMELSKLRDTHFYYSIALVAISGGTLSNLPYYFPRNCGVSKQRPVLSRRT